MIALKIAATVGGVGYLKGGGTIAAVLYVLCWYFLFPTSEWFAVAVLLLVLLVGVVAGNRLEAHWGKDSSRIVLDEVAGMCCTLLFIPHMLLYAGCGLVLFRFFDIVKPLYIREAEKLPGGWGVMLDDLAAGICASLLLQIVKAGNLF